MVVIWAVMGFCAGYQGAKYIRLAGPREYWFKIELAFIGVCLSSLVVEGLYPQILNGASEETQKAIGGYGFLLVVSIVLLMLWGGHLTSLGIKIALKQIFYIFTIFGLLEFLFDQFFQESLLGILWWVPTIDPPGGYRFVFTLAMAGLIAVANAPSAKFSTRLNIDVNNSTRVAPELAEAPQDSNTLPLTLIPFTYKIPEGWVITHNKHDATEYNLWIEPPADPHEKLKRAQIQLVVIQYPETTITDQDQFKLTTYLHVLGPYWNPDVSILADRITTWYGVMAHECFFMQGTNYGCLIRFVIQSNAFAIYLFSSDDETFSSNLPILEDFIEGLHFEVSNGGEEA